MTEADYGRERAQLRNTIYDAPLSVAAAFVNTFTRTDLTRIQMFTQITQYLVRNMSSDTEPPRHRVLAQISYQTISTFVNHGPRLGPGQSGNDYQLQLRGSGAVTREQYDVVRPQIRVMQNIPMAQRRVLHARYP